MKKYFVALSTFVLCLGLFTTDADAARKETIENGVYIGEVNVSNMTIIEAKQAVLDYVEEQGEIEVTLNAILAGKLALMVPVMILVVGRCVAITMWIPTARAF